MLGRAGVVEKSTVLTGRFVQMLNQSICGIQA